jgi:hypothetical protein
MAQVWALTDRFSAKEAIFAVNALLRWYRDMTLALPRFSHIEPFWPGMGCPRRLPALVWSEPKIVESQLLCLTCDYNSWKTLLTCFRPHQHPTTSIYQKSQKLKNFDFSLKLTKNNINDSSHCARASYKHQGVETCKF